MSSHEQLVKLIEHYQKALRINPHSDVIYHQLAELYYQHGDIEKTFEACRQALVGQLDTKLILSTLTKVFTRLGFSGEEIKWLSEALPKMMIEEAIAVLVFQNHEENDHKIRTWKASIISGYAFTQQSLWSDAIECCFTAITLEPSLNFPHFIIQYYILPKIDDIEILANRYTEVIQLSKVNRLAYSVLGDILTKQKRATEATQAYKNAWLQTGYSTSAQAQLDEQRTTIDYLVIGTGKAGTTSLFNYLSQHPRILNPRRKEICFFNERYDYGLDWYLAQFPPRSFSQNNFLTGEATPWYLGTIGAEDRIFQAFPDIKLIAILRDPVSRTISHYYMSLKLGLEKRTLEKAIASEIAILEDVNLRDIKSLEKIGKTYWKTEQGYLWFSLYLPFLKRWMVLFSKQKFLIVDSRNLYNSSSETMNKVFDFLDLPNYDFISYEKSNIGAYPTTDYEIQKTLFDFFCQHNQALEEYLGMEFGWNDQF